MLCLGQGDALCHLQQNSAAGVHTVQRGGFLCTGIIRQQVKGRVAIEVVVGIALHHKALGAGQAELGHHSIQIGGTIIGIRQQQHAASAAQVAAQLAQLIHQTACAGKVLRRIVDNKQVTVLGDGLGEQVKCRDGQVLAFQRIGQGGSQRLLAVVGGVVHMAALSAGQLVDGRGDPAFTVKGHVGRTGGGIITVIVVVKLCGIQHLALFPANQDQPTGGQILCAVLGRKGRVDCRIFQLPGDMAALGGVFVQQLGDDLVLIAGLGQIVNGHILRQVVGHLSGALAQGVEPRLGEIELGISGRNGPDNEIDQHGQHDHSRGNGCRPHPAAEHPPVTRGALLCKKLHLCSLLSVPAALLNVLRREEQEHRRHGQIIDHGRDGEAVVDKILKGCKQAQGTQHSAESLSKPCTAEQKQPRQAQAERRKGQAPQHKAAGAQTGRQRSRTCDPGEHCQRHGAARIKHAAQAGHQVGQQQG